MRCLNVTRWPGGAGIYWMDQRNVPPSQQRLFGFDPWGRATQRFYINYPRGAVPLQDKCVVHPVGTWTVKFTELLKHGLWYLDDSPLLETIWRRHAPSNATWATPALANNSTPPPRRHKGRELWLAQT